MITTPHIPGLELHLPARTVIRDEDGNRVTQVSITPVPVDRTPFPLPAGVEVPIYFTVQPGGGSDPPSLMPPAKVCMLRVLLRLLLVVGVSCRAPSDTRTDKTASLLARDFETIGYADAALLARGGEWFTAADSRLLIRLPFSYVRDALGAIDAQVFDRLVERATGLLVGAEKFQAPAGLGTVTSTRCYVFVLRQRCLQ